jgi:hypothetical protein
MTEQRHETTENDAIPDERDWRKDLNYLKEKVKDFNINNYVKKVLTETQ